MTLAAKPRFSGLRPKLAITTGLFVAIGFFLVEPVSAEEVNVPGIVAGVVDGDVPGIAGSAMGHSYWGRSGYYPGTRDREFDRRDVYYRERDAYYRGRYERDRYGPSTYGPSPYRYETRYRTPTYASERPSDTDGIDSRPHQGNYWVVPANPPVDKEPYEATIANPQENKATLRFTINARWYELKPGEQQVFKGRMPRVIAFDRGGGKELVRYTLSDGFYTFGRTDKGWELYKSEPKQAQPRSESSTE